MKKWKGRAPKKRNLDGLDTAIKMVVYPPAIAGALLFGVPKKKTRRRKK